MPVLISECKGNEKEHLFHREIFYRGSGVCPLCTAIKMLLDNGLICVCEECQYGCDNYCVKCVRKIEEINGRT